MAVHKPRRVVISGCSSGGKSTLLAALADQGYEAVEEAGRRIVRAELASGGEALPWLDPKAFIRKALAVAIADYGTTFDLTGLTFFDRSVIDLMAYAARSGFALAPDLLEAASACRYDKLVLMAPPWPEIYEQDQERQHGFDQAVTEYENLLIAYQDTGYTLIILPKTSVEERVKFVLNRLEETTHAEN